MSFERNIEVAAKLIAVLKEDMHSRDQASYKKETLKDICEVWMDLSKLNEERAELDEKINSLHTELDELIGVLQSDIGYFPGEKCSVF